MAWLTTICSYDGEKLRRVGEGHGVGLVSPHDNKTYLVSPSLLQSLAADYIQAGYTLKKHLGPLADAIGAGDHKTTTEILDILRNQLGLTE